MFSSLKRKDRGNRNPLVIRDMTMFFYTFVVWGLVAIYLYFVFDTLHTADLLKWLGEF